MPDPLPVPPEWSRPIERFLVFLASAGQPRTTLDARRQQLEHLARRAPRGPWELTLDELEDYVASQSWARETLRGRRACFVKFWRWAVDRELTERNIAERLPNVRAQATEPNPVPEQVYNDAMGRSDDRTRLILRMAKEAGMRRAEIAVSHSRDLMPDLDGWSLIVHGKGGKTRIVPLTRRLAFELRALDGHFFPGDIDGHLSPRRVGELAADALPDPWTLHKLRARFATDTLRSSNGNFGLVQDLLGHASANTTRLYAQQDPSSARAAVEAASGSIAGRAHLALVG